MCQKQSGAPMSSYSFCRQQDFKLNDPNNLVSTYQSSDQVKRTFCKNCGSNLQWIDLSGQNEGWACFSTALLDKAPLGLKQKEIHLESKPDWFGTSIKITS